MTLEEAYIFEMHSKAEIMRWNSELRWFRFCRAYGGHVNDGDAFKASIRFSGEAELLRVMGILGVDLLVLPPDNPKPIPGKPYTAAEFEKFRFSIYEFPKYEQPGWCSILDTSSYVSVSGGFIDIHLSGADGNIYDVTETDFENARIIEKHVAIHGLDFIHPPRQCQCVCPECYPNAAK